MSSTPVVSIFTKPTLVVAPIAIHPLPANHFLNLSFPALINTFSTTTTTSTRPYPRKVSRFFPPHHPLVMATKQLHQCARDQLFARGAYKAVNGIKGWSRRKNPKRLSIKAVGRVPLGDGYEHLFFKE